jgi:glycosyl transferase, family 25
MIPVVFFISLILLIYLLKKSKLNERFSNINNFNDDWFNNNIDLFYINLDISHKRRKQMEKQLNKININYNRFNAYNGNLIDKKFNNKLIQDFNTINYNSHIYKNKKGSLGNYISQLTCWYDFYLNSNKKYLMIMEDDIIINNNFNKENMYKIINSVNGIDWAMIKLFCFDKREGNVQNKFLIKSTCNTKNYRHPKNTGMQCYILNKKNIKKLIQDMLPIKNDTFDWKVKYIMMKHNIFITHKNYVETPDHNNSSDRKLIDKQKKI